MSLTIIEGDIPHFSITQKNEENEIYKNSFSWVPRVSILL